MSLSSPDTAFTEVALPPFSFSLATHNLSCTKSPAGPSAGLWNLHGGEGHPFNQLSVIRQQQPHDVSLQDRNLHRI